MPHNVWPHILPTWFWVWARWRLGRKEFAEYGPANPSVRPSNVPIKIPNWAWERLKLLVYGTTTDMGIYAYKGALLRNPRGGVENFVEQRANVYWTACNVGDHSDTEWDYYQTNAILHGICVIPWARCRTEADISNLIRVALKWRTSGLIVNLEIEAKDVLTPRQVSDKLYGYNGQVGISTEAWLYNPPLVDWKPLIKHTCLLQIFPAEAEAAKKPLDCMAHAKALGFQKVAFTYGAHMGQTPNLYDLQRVNYSVYTGDDIGVGNWNKWFV